MPPTCLFLRCPHLLFFAEMSNSPQFFLALQEKLLRCPPSTFFAKMPRAWILLLRCPPPHFFLLRCSAHLIFLAKLLLRWTHLIFFPEMPNLLIFLALLISACQLLRYGPLFFFSWDAQLFSIFFLWNSSLILFLDLEISNIILRKIPDMPLPSPPATYFCWDDQLS